MQRHQQGFEGAVGQRLCGFFALVTLKRLQTLRLVNAFGLIREQHGVAIKCNTNLVGMGVAGMYRVGVDLGCRHTRVKRSPHIGQMGAEKQIGV